MTIFLKFVGGVGMDVLPEERVDRLDIYLDDDSVRIVKNFGAGGKELHLSLDNNKNRLFVEFIDLMLNRGKRDLFVHDCRNNNVYSNLSFAIEKSRRIL